MRLEALMKVWAHHIGNFKPQKDSEWNETLKFDTLTDLVQQFKEKNIARGGIHKLAIVAHGDTGGLVQLTEGDLTRQTIGTFSKVLPAIQDYLWTNARVIFYSCIAAEGTEGSWLLNDLSNSYFPGRHLIGFEKYGLVPKEGTPIATGDVACSAGRVGGNGGPIFPCEPSPTLGLVLDPRKKREQFLSEYSIYAKWSYRGELIKIPFSEVQQNVAPEPKVIYGGKALLDALRKESQEIQYIAMKIARNPTNEVQNLFVEVQRYGFRPGPPEAKVRELTSQVWGALPQQYGPARSFEKETVVAVYKKQRIMRYRCAWNFCPSHAAVQDICPKFASRFPNGPLS
jgi:hypothetical protein